MQVIIISPNSTTHQQWFLSPLMLRIAMMLAVVIILSIYYTAYQLTSQQAGETRIVVVKDQLKDQLERQSKANEKAQMQSYYAKRLGTLQAEAIRLKALTHKLAKLSGLDIEAEGLHELLGQGGLPPQSQTKLTQAEFEANFSQLEAGFERQSSGLASIQDYLITKENIEAAIPSGKPVKKGWISSYYGYRVDPFTGKKAFHDGLDIAGKSGSEILAVADGIVSWRGARGGYGQMIEINHGNGYLTRYAHNKKVVVKLGDRIRKGQLIALMGSTGRSTGPHLHFEILRDGKTVNPVNFVKR